MSTQMVVAKRYAKALYEVAVEQKLVSEVEQQLRLVVELLESDSDFRKFLNHPNIDNAKKIALLQSALQGHVSELVQSTLELVISRGRESILPSLLQYYVTVANEALGRAIAIVYSPRKLQEDESEKLAKQFSSITGKTIQIENVIDEELLGGLKVRIGDRLYDGSLANRLSQMEKILMQKAM